VIDLWTRTLTEFPIAHRGYFDNSGAHPENSAGAILEAVHRGFACELDVMLSADGEAVVFHDDSLSRMCGVDQQVSQLSSTQLCTFKLLKSQEPIPLLSSVLRQVAGQRPLIVELKSFSTRGFHQDGKLEKAVVDAIAHYQGPVALKSFNPTSVLELLRLRGVAEQWPVGLISCDHSKDPDFKFLSAEEMIDFAQLKSEASLRCDFFSYSITDLTEALSQQMRARGPVMVWTVRTEEQFEKARRLADNVVFEWRGVKPEKFRK
jgi:glycerophosphoryl diester phosphodiesterase